MPHAHRLLILRTKLFTYTVTGAFLLWFAVVAALPCTAQVDSEPEPNADEQPFNDPLQLADALTLFGDTVMTTPFGLIIRDLNRAKLSDEAISRLTLQKDDAAFQKALCESCKVPGTMFEAYIALNTLYPEKRLNLVEGPIIDNTIAKIDVKILSGDQVLTTQISKQQFGEIIYDYWRKQFGFFTDVEIVGQNMLKAMQDEEAAANQKKSKPAQ